MMSKIENAMEKAKLLREKDLSLGRSHETKCREPELPPRKDLDQIHITNPLLIVADNYNLPVAEEYRKLKSIIVQMAQRETFKNTLMITSSLSGEGKSLTALNLALSLAQEYDHNVLLVDADLRNPSLCRYLGLEPKAGLANCLMDGTDYREMLIETGLGNLALLPAGKKVINPVELFSSRRMKEFLEQIRRDYSGGYIVFDTPPALPFAEPRILGLMVDGVIFVVREGGTSMPNIKDALESLGDARLWGVVYNKATTASLDGGYHYYYYDNYYKARDTDGPRLAKGLVERFLSRFSRQKSNT